MKYAHGGTGGAGAGVREPLTHSRANTADDDHLAQYQFQQSQGHGAQAYNSRASPLPFNQRGSVIPLDSFEDNANAGGGHGIGSYGHSALGDMGEGSGGAPPAFTPGLFKDPIFEKGVALNLAAAAASSNNVGLSSGAGAGGVGPGGLYGSSPITYSPATPSTAHAYTPGSGVGGGPGSMERQGLIGHARQGTE